MHSDKPQSPPSPAGRPLSLGVIFLTLYIDLVGFSIIFPLFPEMLQYYLAHEGEAGLLGALVRGIDHVAGWTGGGDRFTPVLFGGILGSLYSLLQFAFAPIWGGLSDRYGRRPVLLFTCAGTAVSYLLWTVSGSFGLLVLARLFGGAMSGNLSVATAAVADVTSRENRAKGMGLVGAAFGLGFVTGPAIGGGMAHFNLLDNHPEWSAFGINPFSAPALAALALSTINFVWIALRFRESLPPENRAVAHPLAARDPLKLLRLRMIGPVRRTVFVYFVFIFAFSGLEFSLAFLAVERFAFTPGQITWLMIYIGVLLILTQGGIVRRIVPRYGERKVTLAGVALVCAGFAALSWAPTVGWLYFGLGLTSVGAGCATPALTALVSLYAPAERQGQVLGSFRAFGSLARALGPIAAAVVFWWVGSRISYAAGGLVLIVPLVAAVRLPNPHGASSDHS
ncbi:MFS transporter [Congregicoccus parvus]|uniref:MFS transporter n=1 Tax=Congregicoccus parvus TaxID=3081749 RepID=UPI003FA5E782